MADRRISRRKFLGGVATATTLPALWARDASAQGPAPPTNVRLVSSPPPAPSPGPVSGPGRQLLGGWRIAQDFARGSIAIDFSRMKLYMVGHAHRQEILEYNLPPMGSGSDVNSWPRVDAVQTHAGWWPTGYCNGLVFWRGKVWMSPRIFYATAGDELTKLTLYAIDGERINFDLLQQVFSGFVKRGPGLDPLIGCGGYESGQGSTSGPSLATLSGQPLLQYGWPGDPGAGLSNWNQRAPREPNYRPLRTGSINATPIPEDSWVGWLPRTVNGELQGRWASDTIYGGGLVLPEGITYWAYMGTGDMDYVMQRPTFCLPGLERTYTYRYDENNRALLGYEYWPEFGANPITGQEIGPDGRVYLAHANQWASGTYAADVALKVYG